MEPFDLKWENIDVAEAHTIVEKTDDPFVLAEIAKNHAHSDVGLKALERISDYKLLKDIIENTGSDVVCCAAAKKALDEALRVYDEDMIVSIVVIIASVEIFQYVISRLGDDPLIEKTARKIIEIIKSDEYSLLIELAIDHIQDQDLLQSIVCQSDGEYSVKTRCSAVKSINNFAFLNEVVRNESFGNNIRVTALDLLSGSTMLYEHIERWLPGKSYNRLFDHATQMLEDRDFNLLSSIVLTAGCWDHQLNAWRRTFELSGVALEEKQSLFHLFMGSKNDSHEINQIANSIPLAFFESFDLESKTVDIQGEDEYGFYTGVSHSILYRGVELHAPV